MKIIERIESINVDGEKVRQAIVEFEGSQYTISDNGRETLIFNTDFNAVGGMFELTLEYVIDNFESVLKAGIKQHFMSVFGFSE